MANTAKNLPQAPDGYRWASVSRWDDERKGWFYTVKATLKDGGPTVTVAEVQGHVCVAIPVTQKTAKPFLDQGKDRKYYDPTADEEYTVTGMVSRASELAKHDAESGRGAVRTKALGGKTDWTLEEVQDALLGNLKLTEEMIAKATQDGPEAVVALLKAFGKLGS